MGVWKQHSPELQPSPPAVPANPVSTASPKIVRGGTRTKVWPGDRQQPSFEDVRTTVVQIYLQGSAVYDAVILRQRLQPGHNQDVCLCLVNGGGVAAERKLEACAPSRLSRTRRDPPRHASPCKRREDDCLSRGKVGQISAGHAVAGSTAALAACVSVPFLQGPLPCRT